MKTAKEINKETIRSGFTKVTYIKAIVKNKTKQFTSLY